MPTYIAAADGNFTSAAVWGTVDATALLDSEAANTVLTTAYVESQAFTPGAITIDGIAVKVASRAASPTGTMTIRLAQAGALVVGTEVAINVSDLEATDQGWVFFKFAAPVLLLAATPYTVSAKTSDATMVNLYRNATAGNWSRLLRTTTLAALVAGDIMHILGEWTAAATKTDRTVTMDETAATDYGGTSTTLASLSIGKGGTLTWGTTAATNYILQLSGLLVVYRGGILNMGTTATPCPRGSTQTLQFDCAADGDFGLKVYGTWNAQGLSRTSGKDFARCVLNTDEAVAQTVLGVDTDTGWLSGDLIAIASTSQTASEAEGRTLSVNAGATTITVTAGLTNAHSGTAPTQAEVVLRTRYVVVKSVSTSFMAYVYCGSAAVVDCDWVEFRYLGDINTGKRGVEVDVTASGSLAMSYCSFHQFDHHGIYIASTSSDNWAFDHCVGYLIGNQASGEAGFYVTATTGTAWSITDFDIISGNVGQGACFTFFDLGGACTNLRGNSGGGDGVKISGVTTSPESINQTWSGMICHSNTGAGLEVDGLQKGTLGDVNLWRNNAGGTKGGLYIVTFVGKLTIETFAFFGNSTQNVLMGTAAGWKGLVLRNGTSNGDTTFATTNGIHFNAAGSHPQDLALEGCDFSSVAGIKTAHTVDIQCGASPSARRVHLSLVNTKLGAATEIGNTTSLWGESVITYQKVDQATNVHKRVYPRLGTAEYETTIYKNAAPSEKLSPTGGAAGNKLESSVFSFPIASGEARDVSVWVRKTSTYNGNLPRLRVKANSALGITIDATLALLTVGADTWQQLSGTTAIAAEDGVVECMVDCDGTAGSVYVDDWRRLG